MRSKTDRLALGLAGLVAFTASTAAARIDTSHLDARRAVAAWLEARLGFVVSLASSRLARAGGSQWLFALVAESQGARVACSPVVVEPLPTCVDSESDPVATLVVTKLGAASSAGEPLVVALPSLDVIVPVLARILDAAPAELDGDPARELVVVAGGEGVNGSYSSVLFVLDDDGSEMLARGLTECEDGDDYNDPACDEAFATVSDDDGDGIAEVDVIEGAASDDAIASSLAAGMATARDTDEEGVDGMVDLAELRVTHYELDPATHRLAEIP